MLYLRTGVPGKSYIRRGKLLVSFNNKTNHYVLKNIATTSNYQIDEEHILKPGDSYEIYDWVGMADPIPDSKNIQTRLIDPYHTTFTTDFFGSKESGGHRGKLDTVHVYSRNKDLLDLINTAVDLHLKATDTIPLYYIFPYLFFNQPRYLSVIQNSKKSEFNHSLDQYLKYDPYNKSIRYKNGGRGSKYSVYRRYQILHLLYNLDSVAFSTYRNMEMPRYLNMLIQPPEMSGSYDEYYKRTAYTNNIVKDLPFPSKSKGK